MTPRLPCLIKKNLMYCSVCKYYIVYIQINISRFIVPVQLLKYPVVLREQVQVPLHLVVPLTKVPALQRNKSQARRKNSEN